MTIVDQDFREVGKPLRVVAGSDDGHRWLATLPRTFPQGAFAFEFKSDRIDYDGASDRWRLRISVHRHIRR